MTTQQIAERLVALCSEAKFETAQLELFDEEAISIEPMASPGFDKETKGLPAIVEKGKRFDDMVETMHSIDVSHPLVATNSFAVTMHLDVTMKEGGKMDMRELCVYIVKNGKIISEEFLV